MSERRFSMEFDKLEEVVRDTARPLPDRVLTCFYMFSKAAEEASPAIRAELAAVYRLTGEAQFTAADVAAYMGIEPMEIVEAAIVDLHSRGMLAQ